MLESCSEMFQQPPLEQSLLISTARWSEGWRRRLAKERVRHAAGYRYSGLENSLSAAKTLSEATCRGPTRAAALLLPQQSDRRVQPRKRLRSWREPASRRLRRF